MTSMRLLCIFPSKLPTGSSLGAEGAQPMNAGGKSFCILTDLGRGKPSFLQSFGKAVNTFVGRQTIKLNISTIHLKIEGSKESKQWGVEWNPDAPNNLNVAILFDENENDVNKANESLVNAARNLLSALSCNDESQVLLVLTGISTSLRWCVSYGNTAPNREHVAWELIPDFLVLVKETLSIPGNFLARIMISSTGIMADHPSLQDVIVEWAASDVLEVLKNPGIKKRHFTSMYNCISLDSWQRLAPAPRLAVALAMARNDKLKIYTDDPGHGRQTMTPKGSGQVGPQGDPGATNACEQLERCKHALSLAVAADDNALRMVLPARLMLPDPASTLVAILSMARRPTEDMQDKALQNIQLSWQGTGSQIAAQGLAVFKYISDNNYSHRHTAIWKQLFLAQLAPRVVKELPLAASISAMSWLDEEEVCRVSLRIMAHEKQMKSITDVCISINELLIDIGSPLCNAALHLFVDSGRGLTCTSSSVVKTLCSNTAVKDHEALRKIIKFANVELVRKVLDYWQLEAVDPSNVDWAYCNQLQRREREREAAVATKIASAIAAHWLKKGASYNVRMFVDMVVKDAETIMEFFDESRSVSVEEVETFCSICTYVGRSADNNPNSHIVKSLKQLHAWATWTISAAANTDPIKELTSILNLHQQQIPVSFLRFLAHTPENNEQSTPRYATRSARAGPRSLAREYQCLLLRDTKQERLKPFLPATQEAKSQSDALRKLRKWLSSLNVEQTEGLERSITAFEQRLKAANLPTFPDCLGSGVSSASLAGAVSAFQDDGVSSDLVKLKARYIIRQCKDGEVDPLDVLLCARKEARKFMLQVFEGEIRHSEVKAFKRSVAASVADTKREAAALRDLLSCRVKNASHQDAFFTYLRLTHADPAFLLLLARKLSEFIENVLKIEPPKRIKAFLDEYSTKDMSNLPVFGQKIDYFSTEDIKTPSDKLSVHLVVQQFADLLPSCDEQWWGQVLLLHEAAPLIEFFRGEGTDTYMTRPQLDNKMNSLRIMCISSRALSRPVAALDCLSPYLLNLSNTKEGTVTRDIVELLKSDVITKARKMLALSDASFHPGSISSSSIAQLVQLFRLTDSVDSIANRNLEVLKGSKFVISIKDLRDIIAGADPYGQKQAADLVWIECASQDTFQLAGGRTSTRLAREDMDALFVETLVQLSVAQEGGKEKAQASKGDIDRIVKAQTRLNMVLQLAYEYHECARMGRLAVPADLQARERMEFTTKTPESQRSIFDDDNTPTTETCDIDQHISLLRDQRLPGALKEELQHARAQYPWLTFCPRLDVMQRCTTPWVRVLASASCAYNSAEGAISLRDATVVQHPTHETSRWAGECVRKYALRVGGDRDASIGASGPKAKQVLDKALQARVSAVLVDDDHIMSHTIALLCAVGEWPCPSPTALFPCDSSAVATAVEALAWRLTRAAHILDERLTNATKPSEWQQIMTQAIQGVFLSSGLVITRPDLLPSTLQDMLLSALNSYAQAAPHAAHSFPKVMLVLPNSTGADERCYQKLRNMKDVVFMDERTCTEMSKSLTVHKCERDLTIVCSSLSSIASGIRPRQIDQDAYAILLGKDISIQDLACAVRLAGKRPISLDFGGDPKSIVRGPLAGALVSLFTSGVVGQAQHAAEALVADRPIFVQCAADSPQDLVIRIPLFRVLEPMNKLFVSGKAKVKVGGDTASGQYEEGLFQSLCVQAAGRSAVVDAHVMVALRKLFGADDAQEGDASAQSRAVTFNNGNESGSAGCEMPFVHSARSMRIMGLIAYRLQQAMTGNASHPVLLSGDTGTGKTYLVLKFLELLRSSCALHHALDSGFLRIYTLSAAFRREHVQIMGEEIRKDILMRIQSKGGSDAKVCPVVLDEITGSPAQEALSRLICYRETSDGVISLARVCNAVILATCNPEPKRDSVFPLSPELHEAAIVVEPLSSAEERTQFIEKQLQDRVRGPGLESRTLSLVSAMIRCAEKAIEGVASEERIGTISLRDSVRCASLMKRLGAGWGSNTEGKKVSLFECLDNVRQGSAWAIECESTRVAALSCYLCYGMRVLPRSLFFSSMDVAFSISQRGKVKELLEQVKDAFVKTLSLPKTVVITTALKDNILAVMVAVSARLPLLSLGDDGTSKTLTLNIVLSQMQGRFSSHPVLQSMRRVQPFHLQLSEASTAKHIIALKRTVVAWNAGRDISLESHPCVCMEEMSMADQGPNGPLRALHDLLDSHQESRTRRREDIGTGTNTFSFVATSNYRSDHPRTLPTGRALGNRLLVLAHEPLPAGSLIDLAVCTGLAVLGMQGDHEEDIRKSVQGVVLEQTLTALCNETMQVHNDATGKERTHVNATAGGVSRLVPDLISIRSLLYFSRCLASLLAASVPSREAQVRAFACHLQLQTPEKSKQVWRRVQRALNWPENEALSPTTSDVISDSFGIGRTKRPLLFLYNSSIDIYKVVDACCKAAAEVVTEGETPRTWLICPASNSMVQQRRRSATASHSHDHADDIDRDTATAQNRGRQPDAGDVLHAMVQLRTAVQTGGVIFILNPEPLLDGIHALLNDAASPSSTLQMRQASESVMIHPSTQLVLLVERTAALGMHRALLSRIAVVNSGLFASHSPHTTPTVAVQSMHTQLKKHYESWPGVPSPPAGESTGAMAAATTRPAAAATSTATGAAAVSAVDESMEVRQRYERWQKKEMNLLDQAEMSLETLLVGLKPQANNHLGRLFVTFTRGPIPLSLCCAEHVRHVDAFVYNTPRDFMSRVKSCLDELSANAAAGKQPSVMLIDLTATSSAGCVECLALMGLAGLNFANAAAVCMGTMLLRHACRQDMRVVVALDASSQSSSTFAVPPVAAWEGEGDAPLLTKLVKVVEVRDAFQPFPGWPSLRQVAETPEIVFRKAREMLLEVLQSAVMTVCAGKFVVNEDACKLRERLVDVALRYCLPKEAVRILFLADAAGICSDTTCAESNDVTSMSSTTTTTTTTTTTATATCSNNSINARHDAVISIDVAARIELFKSFSKHLAQDPTCVGSLRGTLITMCRELCIKIAALILHRVPASVIAAPDVHTVHFIELVLRPSVLPWQRNAAAISMNATHLHRTAWSIPQASALVGLPFCKDIMDLLQRGRQAAGLGRFGSSQDIAAVLWQAFPTLKDLELGNVRRTKLVESLVAMLQSDLRESCKGSGMVTEWLHSNNLTNHTLEGTIFLFQKWDAWLSVAMRMTGPSGVECDSSKFEKFVLTRMKNAINNEEGCAIHSPRASLAHAIKHALYYGTRASTRNSPIGMWLCHVVRLWLAQPNTTDEMYKVYVARSFVNPGLQIMEACNMLQELSGSEEQAGIFATALDMCDSEKKLPIENIAAAVFALASSGSGRALLAAIAARRANEKEDVGVMQRATKVFRASFEGDEYTRCKALDFVHEILRVVYVTQRKELIGITSYKKHVAMHEMTILAAHALRNVTLDPHNVIKFVAKSPDKDVKTVGGKYELWHAMRLIAASVGVPPLADTLMDEGSALTGKSRGSNRYRSLVKVVTAAFGVEEGGGIAIRKFLMRVLAAKLGERNVPAIADTPHGWHTLTISISTTAWLPSFVGDWVSEYLTPSLEGPLADLAIVPGFTEALEGLHVDISQGWPNALSQALLSGSDGCQMGVSNPDRLTAALEDPELSFCAVPASMWCVMLEALAPRACILASFTYRDEAGLQDLFVPCAPPGNIELLRSTPGVTSVNRCPCGYLYGIGDCGMPNMIGRCPQCRNPLGGTSHVWATNVNHGAGLGNVDDTVRGIALDWYEEGVGHSERDLSPLAYRIYCVLLLIPLAVYSPQRVQRTAQLRRHWDALKRVCGLPSDTDAQHFMLALLLRATQIKDSCMQGLCGGTQAWNSKEVRANSESEFARAIQSVAGFSMLNGAAIAGGAGEGVAAGGNVANTAPVAGGLTSLDAVQRTVREVVDSIQERLSTLEKTVKPLVELREGRINKLPSEESAQVYAPMVLKLAWPDDSGSLEQYMDTLRTDVVQGFERYPILARVLFDSDSPYVSQALSDAIDLAVPNKLQHLPALVHGLALLHANARSNTAPDAKVREHLQKDDNAFHRLNYAWEACRYGHRLGCQAVPDMGDLKEMPARLVVWYADSDGGDGGGGGGDVSRSEAMLNSLVTAHNDLVRLLVQEVDDIHAGGANAGAAERGKQVNQKDKVQVFDKTVSIHGGDGCAEQIKRVLLKVREARLWLEQMIMRIPAGRRTTAVAESLVRGWLINESCAFLSLDSWPRLVRVPDGLVRISYDSQVPLPGEARDALQRWIETSGLREDQVQEALEWAQRVAALVDLSQATNTISWNTSLLDFSSISAPECMSKVLGAVSKGKGVVCAKHLNALQEHLAELINVRSEKSLAPEYRVQLPCLQDFERQVRALNGRNQHLLKRKLAVFSTKLQHNSFDAEWMLSNCLESVVVDEDEDDEDTEYLGPVEGLQTKHTYYALDALRSLG